MSTVAAAPMLSSDTPRRVTLLDLLAIFVVTCAVFTPVMRTGFAPLDDFIMISGNPPIISPSWEAFKSFWSEPSFRIYMPLALSVWQAIAVLTHHGTSGAADYVLPTYGFKIASIATHALSAAAAGWTLSTLTRSRWPAVVGALVFALHPLQVESVAWTTGLKDELCGLFSVLCVGGYARHAEQNPDTPWHDGWWWAAAAMAVLAMLAKPTAMVLPVLLLAVDWAVRRTGGVRRFVSVGPLLLPAIACGLIIVGVQGNAPVQRVALPLRPLVAADSYAFYLLKIVWPTNLSIDYGRRPGVILGSGAIWWTWLLPAAALVGVLLMRSRRWVLAAVLFAVPVLPVSGIVAFDMQQYSTVTDHYMYQPLLGVGLAVALLLSRRPWPGGWVAVLATATLAIATWRTATKWESLEGLYRRILVTNPHSWLARDLLGVFAGGRGDLFTMSRLVRDSLAENPNGGGTLDNQSNLMLQMGHFRESADFGLRAAKNLPVKRAVLARRLTLLGLRLKDRDLAEQGLYYWLAAEPENRYAAGMLMAIQASKAEEARAKAAARPATSRP